ncbi:hypothetical protein ACFLVC_03125 [Chloroflexota bacterium]
MKVGMWHQRLAYAAAAVALLSVILAGIAKLAGATIVITATSYMAVATVAILFAIYFLVQGAISAGKGS